MASVGDGSETSRKESRRPKYSRFTQQELPACKPLLTPTVVISTFFIIGVIFIPIGAICLAASTGVVEILKRYDEDCFPSSIYPDNDARSAAIQSQTAPACTISVTVSKSMKSPIFVYYQLTNFYQNHRRYVKSRSDSQLRGDSGADLSDCKPEAYLYGNTSYPIDPCGLIAWSLFNDTYSITANGSAVTINETGISWASDRDSKFGSQTPTNFNTDPALRGGATLDPNTPLDQDEHLIVWMRTAALPTFRKLWGRIDTNLEAGTTIEINITNAYNTYLFDGSKSIVLSTTSWLGGKNNFLGIAYVAVGGICIVLALGFLLLQFANPRPLGDTSYLSWNRQAAGAR